MNSCCRIQFLFVTTLFALLGGHAQSNSGAAASPVQPANNWPTKDGWVTLRDFKFGTGETLPELKLHYLRWGRRIPMPPGTWTTRCCYCMARAATPTRC